MKHPDIDLSVLDHSDWKPIQTFYDSFIAVQESRILDLESTELAHGAVGRRPYLVKLKERRSDPNDDLIDTLVKPCMHFLYYFPRYKYWSAGQSFWDKKFSFEYVTHWMKIIPDWCIARMEYNDTGPSLFVCDVKIRSWSSTVYDPVAEQLVVQINTAAMKRLDKLKN